MSPEDQLPLFPESMVAVKAGVRMADGQTLHFDTELAGPVEVEPLQQLRADAAAGAAAGAAADFPHTKVGAVLVCMPGGRK